MHDPDVRLTDEEQRRLEALDAALAADDPDLALGVRMPSQRIVGAVAAVVGALIVVLTFTRALAVAFGGSLLLAAGLYLLLTAVWRWRAPGTSRS
jgi:hypothetical protein